MKTAHYTFTTWNESAMASGFDGAPMRQSVLIRDSQDRARTLGGDNVIDLIAWRAANLDMPEEEEGEFGWSGEKYEEEPELSIPVPRVRKSRRAAVRAELMATMGVAAAALAVVLWVLMF